MNDKLNFDDLKEVFLPVRYQGKLYYLTEASAEAGSDYRDRVISGTRVEDGKAVGMTGLATAQLVLVSHCLFHTDSAGDRTKQRVSVDTLRRWPDRVLRKLFKALEEISELDKDDVNENEDDAAGNECDGIMDG